MANAQSYVQMAQNALSALTSGQQSANATQVNGNITLAMNALSSMDAYVAFRAVLSSLQLNWCWAQDQPCGQFVDGTDNERHAIRGEGGEGTSERLWSSSLISFNLSAFASLYCTISLCSANVRTQEVTEGPWTKSWSVLTTTRQ
jgi:hypothetical protein